MKYQFWAIFGIGLIYMIGNLDFGAVNFALVYIQQNFGISLFSLQWLFSGYLIGNAALLVLAGRLGDYFGYRRIFTIGIVIFFLSSLYASISQNTWQAIFSGIIQGFALSFLWPSSMGILLHNTKEKNHGLAMGLLGIFTGIALFFGPMLAALFVAKSNWHWILFVSSGFSIIALGIIYFIVPKDQKVPKINYLSTFLLITGFFLLLILLYIVDFGALWGADNFEILGWFSAIAVFLVSFVIFETILSRSNFSISILKNVSFLLGLLIRFIISFSYAAFIFFTGIYLQHILGITSFSSSLFYIPIGISVMILSPITGKFIDCVGPKTPLKIGLGILCIGYLTMNIFALFGLPKEYLLIPFTIIGMSMGISWPANNILIIKSLPQKHTGFATGNLYMIVVISQMIALMITSVLLKETGTLHTILDLINKGFSLSDAEIQAIGTALTNGDLQSSLPISFTKEHYQIIKTSIHQSFQQGLLYMIWLTSGLCILAFILSFFIKKKTFLWDAYE